MFSSLTLAPFNAVDFFTGKTKSTASHNIELPDLDVSIDGNGSLKLDEYCFEDLRRYGFELPDLASEYSTPCSLGLEMCNIDSAELEFAEVPASPPVNPVHKAHTRPQHDLSVTFDISEHEDEEEIEDWSDAIIALKLCELLKQHEPIRVYEVVVRTEEAVSIGNQPIIDIQCIKPAGVQAILHDAPPNTQLTTNLTQQFCRAKQMIDTQDESIESVSTTSSAASASDSETEGCQSPNTDRDDDEVGLKDNEVLGSMVTYPDFPSDSPRLGSSFPVGIKIDSGVEDELSLLAENDATETSAAPLHIVDEEEGLLRGKFEFDWADECWEEDLDVLEVVTSSSNSFDAMKLEETRQVPSDLVSFQTQLFSEEAAKDSLASGAYDEEQSGDEQSIEVVAQQTSGSDEEEQIWGLDPAYKDWLERTRIYYIDVVGHISQLIDERQYRDSSELARLEAESILVKIFIEKIYDLLESPDQFPRVDDIVQYISGCPHPRGRLALTKGETEKECSTAPPRTLYQVAAKGWEFDTQQIWRIEGVKDVFARAEKEPEAGFRTTFEPLSQGEVDLYSHPTLKWWRCRPSALRSCFTVT